MKMKLYAKLGSTVGAFLMFAVPGQVQANVAINSGFYAGASVGMSSLSGNQTFEAVELDDPIAVRDFRKQSLSARTAGLGLFAGYGHKWNCLWLGAELSYLFDRLNDKKTVQWGTFGVDKTFTTKSTGAVGGAIHIGYIHHQNSLIYAILGLEHRRFQVSFQDPVQPDPSAISVSKKHSSLAFTPGVGMLLKVARNISVRGEYKYALHRSKTAVETAPIGGIDNRSTLKTSPGVHTVHIGLIYNF